MANVYRQYWRINILTTLEYRENFLIWFLFTFIYHGTAIASLWIILARFPSMNGWSFRDMAFLYALWMVAHALHNTFFSTVARDPGSHPRRRVRPAAGAAARHALPSDRDAGPGLPRRADPGAADVRRRHDLQRRARRRRRSSSSSR
jgi:hypothetical protein